MTDPCRDALADMHPLDLRRIPTNLRPDEYKGGNEFKPFHPSASHVPPDYRDGWNRCWLAARAALAMPQASVDSQILNWLLTEVPSERSDRKAAIGRTIDRTATTALLSFRAWCTPAEAREAMRTAALAEAAKPEPQE